MAIKGLDRLLKFISLQKNNILVHVTEGESLELTFSFNSPATIDQLSLFESIIGKPIPDSYREFLLSYNGAKIFNYDELGGYELLGVDDILHLNKILREAYGEMWVENILVFANCLGDTSYLGFILDNQSNDAPVIDCFCEEIPARWRVIAKNFDSFLDKLIDSEGEPYWLQNKDRC